MNMVKTIRTFVLVSIIICISSISNSAQDNRCRQLRGIPPYTSTVTGLNDDYHYEVQRGKGGVNGFIFDRNGNLTHQGDTFKPAATAALSGNKLIIYESVSLLPRHRSA